MKERKNKSALGRLKSLGIEDISQVALYLPASWDDLTNPIEDFTVLNSYIGETVLIYGRVYCSGVDFSKKSPMLKGSVIDASGFGEIKFSLFGDTRDFQDEVTSTDQSFYLLGEVSRFGQSLFLNKLEIVEPEWVGKLRPRYNGKIKVVKPETVRTLITKNLIESIPRAVENLCVEMDMSSEECIQFVDLEQAKKLEYILYYAHHPKTVEQGYRCQEALEHLAAYRAVKIARSQIPSEYKPVELPNPNHDWKQWASKLPFTLIPKQQLAIQEIVDDLMKDKPMRRLLSGDVGYGKTAVFGVSSMTVFGSGGRVVLMLPSQTLAEQAYRELTSYWPEVKERFALVTEATPANINLHDYDYLIGTTALLFRDVGHFHLMIVDEQQKMGLDQREQLMGDACHLLEATATCIPRSQALLQFGGFKATILDEPPVPKQIHTKIRYAFERSNLFNEIKETIRNGYQALIVYPRKVKDDDEIDQEKTPGILDVESSAQAWEKLMPGRVRYVHSSRSNDDNEQSLKDMREENADILVATTVVEVGVNIPKLRHVIIVEPHRFGLSTLHQIRGRAARTGGEGTCDLLVMNMPKGGIERLEILEKTNNGFEIAIEDLRIRGCGDLSSNAKKQSGADEVILFGRFLTPDRLEQAIDLEKAYYAKKNRNT